MTIKATELEQLHSRFIWQGVSGIGKTHLVGYMHNRLKELGTRGIYYCDFEKGSNTLSTNKFDVDLDFYIDANPEKPKAFQAWMDKMNYLLDVDGCGYGGIAVGTLTSFQTAMTNYAVAANVMKGERKFFGRRLTNINDYGVISDMFVQLFPQLIELSQKFEFILEAHVQTIDVNGQKMWVPAMKGEKVWPVMGGWFNEVWNITTQGYGDGVVRMVQTGPSPFGDIIVCKTQIAGMPFQLRAEEAVDRALWATWKGAKEKLSPGPYATPANGQLPAPTWSPT